MTMYLRLHRGQYVDAVIPSSVGVPPAAAPGDVVWSFDSDINPSKVIQVTENVQAVDPVSGQPLFNEDGTPQWETETVTDPHTGETTTQIVTQQVNKTVYLWSGDNVDPTQFVPADFASFSHVEVGSIEEARKVKKQQIDASFAQSLAAGFQSSADGTARTYTLDETAYSRINGYLAIVNAGKGLAERSWFTIDGTQVQFSPTQFVQFAVDAFAFYDSQYAHKLGRYTDADNAQTNDDVNAIQW